MAVVSESYADRERSLRLVECIVASASSQMHGVYIVNPAELERVVWQESRQVVVVIAGQLVVQARQGITCWVGQPEARIARIATSGRIRGVRCGKTCATNNHTLITISSLHNMKSGVSYRDACFRYNVQLIINIVRGRC